MLNFAGALEDENALHFFLRCLLIELGLGTCVIAAGCQNDNTVAHIYLKMRTGIKYFLKWHIRLVVDLLPLLEPLDCVHEGFGHSEN